MNNLSNRFWLPSIARGLTACIHFLREWQRRFRTTKNELFGLRVTEEPSGCLKDQIGRGKTTSLEIHQTGMPWGGADIAEH